MAFWMQGDGYNLQDEDDDSSDISSSSEDEIDIILHGTPEQKRKLKHLQDKQIVSRLDRGNRREQSASSEDEFEKEMNAELAQHIHSLEKNKFTTASSEKPSSVSMDYRSDSQFQSGRSEKTFYDDVYFDSDEEVLEDEDDNNDPSSQGTRKHAVISNDDLLYDPTLDDKDQKWVDRQRQKNNNTLLDSVMSQRGKNTRKKVKLPSSDALLDCPACLTTLCIDCQRHETYRHQYRAMFVMNCEIDNTQTLQCPEQQKGKRKKKKGPDTNSGDTSTSILPEGVANSSSDLFHPVKCTECNTVVGVIDTDEVYHFFNVLASYT